MRLREAGRGQERRRGGEEEKDINPRLLRFRTPAITTKSFIFQV